MSLIFGPTSSITGCKGPKLTLSKGATKEKAAGINARDVSACASIDPAATAPVATTLEQSGLLANFLSQTIGLDIDWFIMITNEDFLQDIHTYDFYQQAGSKVTGSVKNNVFRNDLQKLIRICKIQIDSNIRIGPITLQPAALAQPPFLAAPSSPLRQVLSNPVFEEVMDCRTFCCGSAKPSAKT